MRVNPKVYTNYNLRTTTTRPSNIYKRVNYGALVKKMIEDNPLYQVMMFMWNWTFLLFILPSFVTLLIMFSQYGGYSLAFGRECIMLIIRNQRS